MAKLCGRTKLDRDFARRRGATARGFATLLLGCALWTNPAAGEDAAANPPQGVIQPQEEALETATMPKADRPVKPYGWKQVGSDLRYLLRRPTRMDRQDRFHLSSGAGAVGVLYLLRQEIRDRVQEHRDEDRSAFLQDVRLLSRGAVAPGLALIFYASSLASGDDRERETGLMLVESALLSAAGAAGGAFVLATERPEEGDDIRFFDPAGRGVSVDAALAASLVEPLRCQYLRVQSRDRAGRRALKWGLSGLLYTAAGLVAYQRVDDNKHWAPDATLGVLMGLGVGRTLCEAHGRYRGPGVGEKPRGPRVVFTPAALPGGAGVALRVRLGK